jgi:ubiquinone/menaquinone biosynthesis C-methylase UbiE
MPSELPDTARRSDSPLSFGALDIATNVGPHIPRGQTVLEVGCGFGFLSALILEKGNQLTALDISTAAVAECRSRFGDKAKFVEADVITYQTDERFSYAFINEVLDQIPDDVGALAAVFALLKPGGRLVLSTTLSEERFIEASVHHYDADEIQGKVRSVGFTIANSVSYGGVLSHIAAVMSRRFRFSKRLLSLVRSLPLYKQLVTMDSKLGTKGGRLILVCEKPAAK